METFDFTAFFNFLGIDWIVVLLYICAGLIGKTYLPDRIRIPFTKKYITDAWRTLILGTIIISLYVAIWYKYPEEFSRGTIKKLFISYFFTTSFYELALKDTVAARIISILEKLKPSKDNTPTT